MKTNCRRMKKALTISLATLMGLSLCELGLRLLWHNPYRRESPDHVLKIRMNHPNTDYFINRALVDPEGTVVRLRTDARSYILPSFQYSDPDATVVFMGGSTTQLSAVRERIRFPALVSELLTEHGLRVNTLNAARSSNTLHDSLNILLNHVVVDRPDIVVLMQATNDIGVLAMHGDYRSRRGHPVVVWDLGKWSLQIASSYVYLAALVRRSATLGGEIRPIGRANRWKNDPSGAEVPVSLYRQRLKAFVHICRDFDIEPVLMTQPLSTSTNTLTPDWTNMGAQDQFNHVIRTVGDEEGVLIIDLVRYLEERVPGWNNPMEIFYDGMHITDRGSQVFAQPT